ncbi:hypothetical protein NVP1238A_82 [Vibrio phage 1.238.A._10N.261.52.F10]|uniref:Uncharacterized protein n=1 Tax=Vibrio phage 1.238.A._10N.261.52.F10 TaxID=1881231 RepID=A0A2I7RUU4_9CAUD|nr:hypothetical protein KNT79_gp82 [Vibrio phage 1.238.A._10N.261.52.F10]AUR97331.1 hypothetical protein NVP1238A_82 [Vibrio phage 1.238.A._10N.261.52.F10]AUR97425.1 hypothetical protein NVP1238B_83 [Vibrio phage 1.238.B._10N.261.52.F10]
MSRYGTLKSFRGKKGCDGYGVDYPKNLPNVIKDTVDIICRLSRQCATCLLLSSTEYDNKLSEDSDE